MQNSSAWIGLSENTPEVNTFSENMSDMYGDDDELFNRSHGYRDE